MAKKISGQAASPASTDEPYSVRSIERAVEVLQAFSVHDPTMTVSEIAKRVRLSRPTLYRILHTLETKGFIRSGGEPLRYELGHAVAQIAQVWLARLDPARIGAPILARLWNETNETVALCMRQGVLRVCVFEQPGRQPLSYARGIGNIDGLASTASGRAMLAFLPEEEAKAVLDSLSERRDELLLELAHIRRSGIAISGGAIAGIRGVAAPVFDLHGKVVASVSVTGPETRIPDHRLPVICHAAQSAAQELSAALGYTGPP